MPPEQADNVKLSKTSDKKKYKPPVIKEVWNEDIGMKSTFLRAA